MPRAPRPANVDQGPTNQSEDSVGYLMKRILLSLAQQTDRRLAEHDLTTTQWRPLMHLKMEGKATVAELARNSHTDAGAMTRLLDRLEKKGLCKRVRSTADRRVVEVELTPEGETVLGHVPGVLSEVMNEHLAGFTRAEWQTLLGFLKRMADTGDTLRESE